MKITCPVCDAKYSITDEKVQDRLAKIRCRKCGTTIVIDGKVDPPNVYAAETPAAAAGAGDTDDASMGVGGEYTVDFGENDQRNMSLGELTQAFKSGQVTRDTYVWAEGFADWKAFGDVPELTQAVAAAAPKAPAPAVAAPVAAAAPAAAAGLPWDKKATPTIEEDADERTQIATRGASTLGGAADLFGGFATAGSEEEVTTSAHQHDAPAPAAAQVTASTGARNESSVLFSLSALTAAAASKPSHPPPGPSAPSEDSGLIDLKALASAAQKSPANAPNMGMAAVPLGLSPLGAPSPFGSPAVAMAMPSPLAGGMDFQQPKKSKTGLYILLAAVLLGAVAIAVALILKPSGGGAESAAAPVATATATATAEVAAAKEKAPEPAAEPAAAPPATGTAEAAAAPDAKTASAPKAARASGGKRASKASSSASSASKSASEPAAAAPAAPKKKSGGCGCAPGDLMCAMQCASK